jgi:hypothetical protein
MSRAPSGAPQPIERNATAPPYPYPLKRRTEAAPGRSYFPKSGLTRLAEYQVETTRELKRFTVNRTFVWTLDPRPLIREQIRNL